MDKTQKIIYYLTTALFIISGICLGIYYFSQGNKMSLYLGLGTPLFLLIPFAFYKCNIKIPYKLLTFFFIYLIMGYNIGFIMDGYKKFILLYFDKTVHFTSGFLFAIIGLCIFFHAGKTNCKKWELGLFFALFFSMFIALTFEFSEFTVYCITDKDPQLNLTTGVIDTMEDLAACLFSSLITVFSYFLHFSKGRKIIKSPIIDEFCKLNNLS